MSPELSALHALYIAERAQDGKDTDKAKWLGASLLPVFGHLKPIEITKKVCREYAAAQGKLGRKPHSHLW